jgi:N-acyl-D-aspartate/D-glutamate deacylase
MYDLIVRGGTVVDGSGLAPRRADVAVRDQRIVAVGRLRGEQATREIDADGLIVSPGIVDVHTHYDPQITWDASCDTSVRHGVTTVVAGNCGFSIAPCHRDDHAYLAQMFARVEGMALEAFDHVRWDFETFPEFLRSREGQLGVNFGCYVGHSAVCRYVMGDASFEREASDDEIASMQALVDDAMRGGAMGFSSAQVNLHFDTAERPVPSRLASDREINALVDVVGRYGIGSLAIAPYSTVDGLDDADCDRMIDYVKRAGVPMVFQGYGGRNRRVDPDGAWRGLEALLDRSVRERAPVYSLVMMRNSNASFHLAQGTSLYESVPLWAALMALTPQERRVAMRDMSARAAYQDAIDHPQPPPSGGATTPPSWDGLRVRRTFSAENEGYERRSIQEIATAEQRRPVDVMFDIALADDLRTLFHWSNESTALRDVLRRVQFHPMVLPGISDGGAHLERDDGAEWSTYFLRMWCLDEGGWPIEAAIRRLTAVPAAICGIRDRGQLQVGSFADMMLFDPARIDIGERSLGVDRITKTERFYSAPAGIAATIVNGEVVVDNGELIDDARPGSVIRPA